jgi:hypothetical protein
MLVVVTDDLFVGREHELRVSRASHAPFVRIEQDAARWVVRQIRHS